MCLFRVLALSQVMPAAYRAVQLQPNAFVPSGPKSRQPMNIEATHYGKHMLDLALETELGICPPEWSTTSQMNDTRPNGRSMFDARHVGSPMGRARGGHAMEWDPTGVAANRGKLAKAINKDSAFFAADMADETAAAEKSADLNKYGNNTNFSSFDDNSMMLAQMSKLQRKQMDKDGDGNLDAAELAAHGFHGMK